MNLRFGNCHKMLHFQEDFWLVNGVGGAIFKKPLKNLLKLEQKFFQSIELVINLQGGRTLEFVIVCDISRSV